MKIFNDLLPDPTAAKTDNSNTPPAARPLPAQPPIGAGDEPASVIIDDGTVHCTECFSPSQDDYRGIAMPEGCKDEDCDCHQPASVITEQQRRLYYRSEIDDFENGLGPHPGEYDQYFHAGYDNKGFQPDLEGRLRALGNGTAAAFDRAEAKRFNEQHKPAFDIDVAIGNITGRLVLVFAVFSIAGYLLGYLSK